MFRCWLVTIAVVLVYHFVKSQVKWHCCPENDTDFVHYPCGLRSVVALAVSLGSRVIHKVKLYVVSQPR